MSHAQQPPKQASALTPAGYHRLWILSVAGLDAVSGGIYTVGGTATSPTLALLTSFLPMPMWGAALVVSGVLLIARRHVVGGFVGGVAWLMLTAASALTLINHTATAAGGWATSAGIAMLHLLLVYGAASGLSSGAKKG